MTYDLLDSTTLTSSASSVTFSSISQDYRDLVLVVSGFKETSGLLLPTLWLNGDTTSSNYNQVIMEGTGSSAFSSTNQPIVMCNYGYFTNTSPAVIVSQIMDYSATDKHTTVLNRANNAANGVHANAGRWSNTAAITQLQVYATSNFAAGSTFYLYGIAS